MARISGVDLPRTKRVEIGLTYIYGIGRVRSNKILGEAGRGPRLSEGMVLAIEPMVNAGKSAVKVLADGWTAVTRDKSLSAHFEHTVAVTAAGAWILTAREVPVAARK